MQETLGSALLKKYSRRLSRLPAGIEAHLEYHRNVKQMTEDEIKSKLKELRSLIEQQQQTA
jgi:hypothetical protein